MIKIIRYTVVVLTTLMILLLVWQFSVAIVLFLLSLALAAALRPVINTLTGRHVPKRLALGIVYSLLIAAIASSILMISPALLDELQTLTDDFVANYDRAKAEWPERGTVFQQTLAEQLPPSADFYQALMSEQGVPAIAGVFGLAQNFLETLGRIAIIIVLSLYWSADQFRFERLGLSLLPEAHHPRALHIWRSVESGVGSYLRSELIQSVLTGLFLWLVFSVLGIRYATLLALWGAIVRLIPWFGALIAVLPALFIGIEISSTVGILATAYTIGILLFLKLVIEPRFFLRNKYSSLLIVLFVIALAETFGFIGVVLAPPLAVAVQILFQNLYPFPEAATTNEVSEEVVEIRKRLLEIRRRMQHSRRRESMRLVERLQRLLRRTTDYLQEEY
ncbi:MAG TPA: AI-2E family transporter [Anaerolineales bacterium]|jgi:predicted PurR-regulated permease PerM|nr:AI-2E family transporter [Anaerolineales bacterium]